jgi:hypothetical protein
VRDQRLSRLRAKPLVGRGAPKHAADQGVDAVENLSALELGLADGEREQFGFDDGGVLAGEFDHGT